MSHCLGVRCDVCQCVLAPDRCPEGCIVGHGYTYQAASEWAAKTWPEHPCYQRDAVLVDQEETP